MRCKKTGFSRRELLFSAAGAALLSKNVLAKPAPPLTPAPLKPEERQFLEDYAKCCFRYFWDQTNEHTGLSQDRAGMDGAAAGANAGSSAATGFGLTALCIGADHSWIPRAQARARVLTTLRFLWSHAFHDHGWYYHFMDTATGARTLNSEISSVDTEFKIGRAHV